MEEYTLIIPTYQRPILLRAQLQYLSESFACGRVLVLDSSTAPAAAANAATARNFPFVDYRAFDSATPFAHKLLQGLRTVATPFVSLCADDDLLFPSALERCLAEIRRRSELSAVHGTYLHFFVPGKPPLNISFGREYDDPSINAADAGARLLQLFDHYESTYYAVCRTPVLRQIFEVQADIPSLLFQELYKAACLVLSGPTLRLPDIYCARRLDGPEATVNRRRWHPMYWAVQEGIGDFFRHYLSYRTQVLDWWRAQEPKRDPAQMEQLLDSAHYIYVQRTLLPEHLFPAAAQALGVAPTDLQRDRTGLLEGEIRALLAKNPAAIESPLMRQIRRRLNGAKLKFDQWADRRVRLRANRLGYERNDCPVVFGKTLYGAKDHPAVMAAIATVRAQVLREQKPVTPGVSAG